MPSKRQDQPPDMFADPVIESEPVTIDMSLMIRASIGSFGADRADRMAEASRRAILAAQIVADVVSGRFKGLGITVAAGIGQREAIMVTFERGFPAPASEEIRRIASRLEADAVESARATPADRLPAAPAPLLRTKASVAGP